jgi:diadenosine tetraphosphate (Ap4A) HIT family hydrolase
MTDCLFCRIGEGDEPYMGHPENTILLESHSFYVKPALGHFVEGYCLVVSKDHLQTMAELDDQEYVELEELLSEVSRRLTSLYDGGLCSFEHGAVCPTSRAGACIDHAHIHLLPNGSDLTPKLAALESKSISSLGELRWFDSRRKSYIYYESRPGVRRVYSCDERVPSQFMRRLLCEHLGMDRDWDWRLFPYF